MCGSAGIDFAFAAATRVHIAAELLMTLKIDRHEVCLGRHACFPTCRKVQAVGKGSCWHGLLHGPQPGADMRGSSPDTFKTSIYSSRPGMRKPTPSGMNQGAKSLPFFMSSSMAGLVFFIIVSCSLPLDARWERENTQCSCKQYHLQHKHTAWHEHARSQWRLKWDPDHI